ncbi:helix-turn-helix domain-containing protein [Rhizobium sp. P32RR-XVIII]|uniref:helix-turn-helix domain-containing protein n=1 Tax=Rhizobium sp. P32RR-XVIII TaxID=2726738 RepID=UPI0014564EBE|nr:helix-turn-helix domain-containing protein [Rhizobium sp. P32RR-XVIII]NLS07552.1 helix-turn-helix domain-containing protein [Rhizobium sp. P32RR-XVIII]
MTTEDVLTHATLLERQLDDVRLETSAYEAAGTMPVMGRASYLPSFEFSTEGLARSDQFAAWRNSFAAMLELTEVEPTTTDFRGRQKLWDLGSLVLAQISTDSLEFSSLPGHVRRDPVDHWTMTVLLSGQIRTDAARRAYTAGPGEVQIHSLGGCFTGVVDRSEMLILFVPRDLSLETAATLGSAEFSTLSTGMGRLFSDYLVDVANRLPMLTQADLPGLAAATRAMILACVSPSADHIEAAEGPIANVLLERARQLVRNRLLDPKLGSELVRRELGISRTRLYNLFEPFGGVMHYIQHRRLLSAYAALADPKDRRLIFQIAEECGFSDGAEFSRAFKRAFGDSPSEVRNRGGGGIPIRLDLEDCPSEERLGVLLRRLQG